MRSRSGGKKKRLSALPDRVANMESKRVQEQSIPVPGSGRRERLAGFSKPYNRRHWRDGVRPQKLRQDPLCEDHLVNEGRTVPATEVDHRDGDPTNNAPANLRSLCKSCHSKKTAKHDGSFGRPPTR